MDDFAALIEGARTGDAEQVEGALAAGVSIHQLDGGGDGYFNRPWSALTHATDANLPGIVRLLMDKGYDVTRSYTPFQIAIRYGHLDALKELLRGINLSSEDEIRDKVLTQALENADTAMLLELGKAGAPWKRVAEKNVGMTRAVTNQNPDAIRFRIEHGADVNALSRFWSVHIPRYTNDAGHLSDAAYIGAPDVIELLVDHGASPNAITSAQRSRDSKAYQETPLVNAVRANCGRRCESRVIWAV